MHYITFLDLLSWSISFLIMIWTYDGHTDVSTLTQAIALWKQYSDYLVLYIRFQSLPCVKAPPSGFWINPFSESAKQKTELGPSSYINSVYPLEVSPPPAVLFPITSTSLGQDQWMWLLWLAFSLSQPVLFSETLVHYLCRSVLAPSNISSCIIAISPWVFSLPGCRTLRR